MNHPRWSLTIFYLLWSFQLFFRALFFFLLNLFFSACFAIGAQTIINSCLVHPKLPLIATAGVEHSVFLHSPFPSSVPPNTTPPSRDPDQGAGPSSSAAPAHRIVNQQVWRRANPDWQTILTFDDFIKDGGDEDVVTHGITLANFSFGDGEDSDLELGDEDEAHGMELNLLRMLAFLRNSGGLGEPATRVGDDAEADGTPVDEAGSQHDGQSARGNESSFSSSRGQGGGNEGDDD